MFVAIEGPRKRLVLRVRYWPKKRIEFRPERGVIGLESNKSKNVGFFEGDFEIDTTQLALLALGFHAGSLRVESYSLKFPPSPIGSQDG